MDSFELNKIIAAVLLTALIVIGIGKFTDILFHVEKPKESAYKVEGLETASVSTSTETTEKVVEIVDIKGKIAEEIVDLMPLWLAVVYVACFEYLGFLTATFLYVTVTMKYLGQKTWQGSAGYGFGLTVTLFAVFYYGLLGELPRGELLKLHEWLPFLEDIRSAITG